VVLQVVPVGSSGFNFTLDRNSQKEQQVRLFQEGKCKSKMKTSVASGNIIPLETIERRIFLIRGQKVMFDRHLAELYGVPTMRLNEAVKRNAKRFPPDFMFQLSVDENDFLISQFAISKGRSGHRKLPFVFTEQGIAMLSSVLKSDRAVLVNIEIMRAFVKLRQLLSTHKDLAAKLEELEKKYDAQFQSCFLRQRRTSLRLRCHSSNYLSREISDCITDRFDINNLTG